MTTMDDMERRIAALEAQLAHLSQGKPNHPGQWAVRQDIEDGTWGLNRIIDAAAGTTRAMSPDVRLAPADTGHTPMLGERGFLLWDKVGKPRFYSGLRPAFLRATANMTADDTFYNASYIKANGTVIDAVQVKRPPGIKIEQGDYGFLGKDAEGSNLFIPCHARHYEQLPLTLEVRTSEPDDPETGRIWLRTDLL